MTEHTELATATPMSLPCNAESFSRDGRMYLTLKSINDITSTTVKSGIVKDMPREVYNGVRRMNPSSLASGLVDHVEVDPNSIKFAFESPDRERAAAARDRMDRGTLAHLFLLQPERIATDVAIWTGGTRKSAAWDKFEADNGGRLILKEEDYNAVALACKEFRNVKAVANLLTDLDAEVAMFSSEFGGGIFTKGLVDAVTRGSVCNIIDIKTTEAGISYKQVERTIRDFNYREKMAAYKRWYQRESGREVVGCYDLFLSMVPPYAVRLVKISEMALEWGEERIVTALDAVNRCLTDDAWPMFVRDDVAIVSEWEKNDEEIEALT